MFLHAAESPETLREWGKNNYSTTTFPTQL